MKVVCRWTEKMKLTASADGHDVAMDAKAPLGSDSAMTPKQMMLSGLCGCTALDVVALMKKYKQDVKAFWIDAEADPSEPGKHPVVLTAIRLNFQFEGEIDSAKAIEAVTLSQTKYCGVSAMISRAAPISFTVTVNGSEVHSGRAQFAGFSD